MTVLVDKISLFSTFSVSCFDELESSFNTLSPSMTEYYLSDIAQYNSEDSTLSKNNIQKSLMLDNYYLYLDYDENIFLEIEESIEEEYENATLW